MSGFLGKSKLIRDISANTVQMIVTQVFGLLIFYLTSKYLSKADFGGLNWSLALGSTLVAIASLGLDLVVVRKIAAGENVLTIGGIHLFHTLCAGLVICGVSLALVYLVPGFSADHPLLLLIFLHLAISNVANSFRLCLNGLESYGRLALLALLTNVGKLAGIVWLYLSGQFTLGGVVTVYLGASCVELIGGHFLLRSTLSRRVKPLVLIMEYKYFILEALPQLGVVLFDSALARIDWILLGLISSAAITAEYSFAYKVFEVSKLPLLIIAPVLLTRLSRTFGKTSSIDAAYRAQVNAFFSLELFLIMLVPLALVSAWTPLVDFVTDGKYGAVNESVYWVLATCVPLAGMINFLWTLAFVQGQLRLILFITVIAAALNVLLNLLLIPSWGGLGAAIAYLCSTLTQVVLYALKVEQGQISLNLRNCVIFSIFAVLSALLSRSVVNHPVGGALLAVGLFCALVLLTRQIKIKDVRILLSR